VTKLGKFDPCVVMQVGSERVGMLRLTSFNARAQRDLAKAITSLESQGAKVCSLNLNMILFCHCILYRVIEHLST